MLANRCKLILSDMKKDLAIRFKILLVAVIASVLWFNSASATERIYPVIGIATYGR